MTHKTITAIIGDTHIGSTTALSPSTFTIHGRDSKEAQTVGANLLGAWLLENWNEYWKYVYGLVGKKNRLIVVHLGDVIDGNHHGSNQLIQEIGDQAQIAADMLKPIAKRADAFFGILGTGAHAGQVGANEVEIYKALGAAEYGQQLTLDIDGLIHDFAHHGRAGRRPWTSAAANLGTEVMIDYAVSGMRPPDYIWRGHNHIIDDSGSKLPGTRVICTPSWQLKTEYGWKVSANTVRSDIGGFIMDGDRLDDSRARYKAQPDGRRIIKA